MLPNSLLTQHYLFTIKILLGLLGALISYAYQDISHYYWLTALLLFAALDILPYRLNLLTAEPHDCRLMLQRWLGGLICAAIIYSLYTNGRLLHEETGLILLSLLVLMLYQECINLPTKRAIYLVILMFLTDLLLTFTEMGMTLEITLSVVGISISSLDYLKSLPRPVSV